MDLPPAHGEAEPIVALGERTAEHRGCHRLGSDETGPCHVLVVDLGPGRRGTRLRRDPLAQKPAQWILVLPVGGRLARDSRRERVERPDGRAFVGVGGAGQLTDGLGLAVDVGLIYAGQAGAGNSHATLGSRIRGNHLGSDIYGSTFRLTLASALRTSLALEPIGGGQRVTRPAASGGRIVDTVPQEDF